MFARTHFSAIVKSLSPMLPFMRPSPVLRKPEKLHFSMTLIPGVTSQENWAEFTKRMQSVVDINEQDIFIKQVFPRVCPGMSSLECSTMHKEHDRKQGAAGAIRSDLENQIVDMTPFCLQLNIVINIKVAHIRRVQIQIQAVLKSVARLFATVAKDGAVANSAPVYCWLWRLLLKNVPFKRDQNALR